MKDNKLKIYIDGSCRANGKDDAIAGVGIVGKRGDKTLFKYSALVDAKTNNGAEYLALYYALKLLEDLGEFFDTVLVYSDSSLVINQIRGDWKINKPELKTYYDLCILLMTLYEGSYYDYIDLKWIKREDNEEANNLAQDITEL